MFSFCHFLYYLVLYSKLISMTMSNKRAPAGPSSLSPPSAAEEGKAMRYVSAEPSSGWKLITLGCGVLIFSGIGSPNRLIERAQQPPCGFPGGRTGACCPQAGAAAGDAHTWPGITTWGGQALWRKARCQFTFNSRGTIFLSKEKIFFFF